MKKSLKIFMLALFLVPFGFIFAACGGGEEGSPPVTSNLTYAQLQDYLKNTVEFGNKFDMIITSEGDSFVQYYDFANSVNYSGGEDYHAYLGKYGDKYIDAEWAVDPASNRVIGRSKEMSKAWFESYSSIGFMDLSYMMDSFIEGRDIAKLKYLFGDDFVAEKFSATKTTMHDGSFTLDASLTFNDVSNGRDDIFDNTPVTTKVDLRAGNNRMLSITVVEEKDKNYFPDDIAYNANALTRESSINFRYGEDANSFDRTKIEGYLAELTNVAPTTLEVELYTRGTLANTVLNLDIQNETEYALPTPVLEQGETFLGWYYDERYSNKVVNNTLEFPIIEPYGIELYGKTSKSGIPNFEFNGGSAPEPKLFAKISSYIYECAPQKYGYRFDKFTLNGNDVVSGDNTMSTSDMTLVAHYVELTKATFDCSELGYKIPPVEVDKGGNVTLPTAETISKRGKLFKGWSLTKGGEIISGPVYTMNENTTFYPVFENAYTVTFNNPQTSNVLSGIEFDLTYVCIPTAGTYQDFMRLYQTYTLNSLNSAGDVGYFDDIYTDAACTQVFSAYPTADTTIYYNFVPKAQLKTVTFHYKNAPTDEGFIAQSDPYALSYYKHFIYTDMLNSSLDQPTPETIKSIFMTQAGMFKIDNYSIELYTTADYAAGSEFNPTEIPTESLDIYLKYIV